MTDKIINYASEEVIKGAVAQFQYKGWLISFSQTFNLPTVAIFKNKKEFYNLPSVEFAISKINNIESERE